MASWCALRSSRRGRGEQERRSIQNTTQHVSLQNLFNMIAGGSKVSIESAAKTINNILIHAAKAPGDQEPPDQLETVTAMLKLVDRKRTKMIDYVQFSRAFAVARAESTDKEVADAATKNDFGAGRDAKAVDAGTGNRDHENGSGSTYHTAHAKKKQDLANAFNAMELVRGKFPPTAKALGRGGSGHLTFMTEIGMLCATGRLSMQSLRLALISSSRAKLPRSCPSRRVACP